MNPIAMNQQIAVKMNHISLSYVGGDACENVLYEYEALSGELYRVAHKFMNYFGG